MLPIEANRPRGAMIAAGNRINRRKQPHIKETKAPNAERIKPTPIVSKSTKTLNDTPATNETAESMPSNLKATGERERTVILAFSDFGES